MRIPASFYSNQQEGIRFTEEGPFVTEQGLLDGEKGLTKKEMLFLRLGIGVGQVDREMIHNRLQDLAPLCTPKEALRMFAEAVLLRGETVRLKLVSLLGERYPGYGWHEKFPVDLIELVRKEEGISLEDRCAGKKGMTKRELALMGIGVTFGARCWYTWAPNRVAAARQEGLFSWEELSGPVVAGITREEGAIGYSNFRLVVLKEAEKRLSKMG